MGELEFKCEKCGATDQPFSMAIDESDAQEKLFCLSCVDAQGGTGFVFLADMSAEQLREVVTEQWRRSVAFETERAAIADAVLAIRNRPEIDACNVSLRGLVTVLDELATLANRIRAGHYAPTGEGKSDR